MAKLGISPDRQQDLVKELLYTDPTKGAMIQARFMIQMVRFIQASNMTEHERKGVLNLMLLLALKLTAIWTHQQRYIEHEDRLILSAKLNPMDKRVNKPVVVNVGQDLYLEVDGFVVQLKSLLDHMINVLHYTMGIKFSALHTFGDSGATVIGVLRNNVPAKPSNYRQVAQMLIEHIEANQDWLKGLIKIRDRMNHFTDGGLPPRSFRVVFLIEEDGTEKMIVPRINKDSTMRDWMQTLFVSVMDFVEYFMGVAFTSRVAGYAFQFRERDSLSEPRWAWFDAEKLEEALQRGDYVGEPMPSTPKRESKSKPPQ